MCLKNVLVLGLVLLSVADVTTLGFKQEIHPL